MEGLWWTCIRNLSKKFHLISNNDCSNTVFLIQDSQMLTYDRDYPNGDHNLRERIVQNLPSKPKVYSINLF